MGIGNSLKMDDGAGPWLIKKLKGKKLKNDIDLLDAGPAPENFTGRIRRLNPETLLIVDALDLGQGPGTIRAVDIKSVKNNGFDTHSVSLKLLTDFLKNDLPGLRVLVVGIQPKNVGFGSRLSPEVEKAVESLCTNFI